MDNRIIRKKAFRICRAHIPNLIGALFLNWVAKYAARVLLYQLLGYGMAAQLIYPLLAGFLNLGLMYYLYQLHNGYSTMVTDVFMLFFSPDLLVKSLPMVISFRLMTEAIRQIVVFAHETEFYLLILVLIPLAYVMLRLLPVLYLFAANPDAPLRGHLIVSLEITGGAQVFKTVWFLFTVVWIIPVAHLIQFGLGNLVFSALPLLLLITVFSVLVTLLTIGMVPYLHLCLFGWMDYLMGQAREREARLSGQGRIVAEQSGEGR